MKNIENLIKEHTKDDVTDWTAIENAVNEEINNIVTKDVAKEKEKFESTQVNEVLKTLGYENVEDLKKTLDTVDEVQKALETKDAEIQGLKTESTMLERTNKLFGMGVAQDAVDYILFNVNKKVTEDKDFETALGEYKTEQPKFFEKTITFGGGSHQTPPPEVDGATAKLKELYPDVDFD